jgi:hypothetical protein
MVKTTISYNVPRIKEVAEGNMSEARSAEPGIRCYVPFS